MNGGPSRMRAANARQSRPSLLTAAANQCRFITHAPRDLFICGEPTVGNLSWCRKHCEIVFHALARQD